MTASLLAFATALVASLGLIVPVRQLALRVGMVDHPGPRKVHLQPIPLLGGIAIYFGVLLGMLVSSGSQAITQILGILAGATLVILVGTLDDRGLLHHQIKLFVGMPIAGLILLALWNPCPGFLRISTGARRHAWRRGQGARGDSCASSLRGTTFASPKSRILALPRFVTKTFPGLMSR